MTYIRADVICALIVSKVHYSSYVNIHPMQITLLIQKITQSTTELIKFWLKEPLGSFDADFWYVHQENNTGELNFGKCTTYLYLK